MRQVGIVALAIRTLDRTAIIVVTVVTILFIVRHDDRLRALESQWKAPQLGPVDALRVETRVDEGDGGRLVGMISAFGGEMARIPPGWLPCDGRAVGPKENNGAYRALILAIESTARRGESVWGDGGDGAGPKVSLPDLRGMFLRGAHGAIHKDAPVSSNTPRQVGTFEPESVGTRLNEMPSALNSAIHTRGLLAEIDFETWKLLPKADRRFLLARDEDDIGRATVIRVAIVKPTSDTDRPTSMIETRPVNSAVNWVIKY